MYLSVARMDDKPEFCAEWLLRISGPDPLCSVLISQDCNILLTARELDELVRVLASALSATPLEADHAEA
jgi:hypothetical protein